MHHQNPQELTSTFVQQSTQYPQNLPSLSLSPVAPREPRRSVTTPENPGLHRLPIRRKLFPISQPTKRPADESPHVPGVKFRAGNSSDEDEDPPVFVPTGPKRHQEVQQMVLDRNKVINIATQGYLGQQHDPRSPSTTRQILEGPFLVFDPRSPSAERRLLEGQVLVEAMSWLPSQPSRQEVLNETGQLGISADFSHIILPATVNAPFTQSQHMRSISLVSQQPYKNIDNKPYLLQPLTAMQSFQSYRQVPKPRHSDSDTESEKSSNAVTPVKQPPPSDDQVDQLVKAVASWNPTVQHTNNSVSKDGTTSYLKPSKLQPTSSNMKDLSN